MLHLGKKKRRNAKLEENNIAGREKNRKDNLTKKERGNTTIKGRKDSVIQPVDKGGANDYYKEKIEEKYGKSTA